MCGIAGFFVSNGSRHDETSIRAMLLPLLPRGPEGMSWGQLGVDGKWQWKQSGQPVDADTPLRLAIGCCRLAIHDVTDRGLQPISNEDGTVWVAQNGEIFNFIELRAELEALGHRFKTKTDTEVIVHSYEEWGRACFNRFNGKFGIAIFDEREQILLLGRDRLGVTPLYFRKIEGAFQFGSEIKAILQAPGVDRRINLRRLAAVIGLPYKLHWEGGDTLFEDINLVRPGECIIVSSDGRMECKRYWTPDTFSPVPVGSFSDARAYLRETLVDAVKIRMRTDRKFSFIVSGGIDSPAVIGIASKVYGVEPETFSLDIPDARFNENDSIREVINYNRVRSNFIPVTPEIISEFLPRVVEAADEPLPTPNGILHGIMADAIVGKGYKVVLNGVGGDEVFFGYHDHFLYFLRELERTGSPKFRRELEDWETKQKRPLDTYQKFCRFLENGSARFSPDFLARSKGFDYRDCLSEEMRANNLAQAELFSSDDYSPRAKQVADIGRLTLPYALRMDDNCYMGRALESRQPFLDYRLVEFGLSLPSKLKIRRGISKFLLRSAVRFRVLPQRGDLTKSD